MKHDDDPTEYDAFKIDNSLPWTMIQSRDYVTITRPVRFARVRIAVEKVNGDTGRVSISESGMSPHMHIQGDIEDLFQEVSYAMHQDMVGGMDDEELATQNADDLILISCAGARALIDKAWHPSQNNEPAYWKASGYEEVD